MRRGTKNFYPTLNFSLQIQKQATGEQRQDQSIQLLNIFNRANWSSVIVLFASQYLRVLIVGLNVKLNLIQQPIRFFESIFFYKLPPMLESQNTSNSVIFSIAVDSPMYVVAWTRCHVCWQPFGKIVNHFF